MFDDDEDDDPGNDFGMLPATQGLTRKKE